MYLLTICVCQYKTCFLSFFLDNFTINFVIFSSWNAIKYWKPGEHFSISLTGNDYKLITNLGIYESKNCVQVKPIGTCTNKSLIWIDSVNDSFYQADIMFTYKEATKFHLSLNNITKIPQETKFGNYSRLTIDKKRRKVYVSRYHFGTIDMFDLDKSFQKASVISNLSKPSDIKIDEERNIMFVIENSTCILKIHLSPTLTLTRPWCFTEIKAIAPDVDHQYIYWSQLDGSIWRSQYDSTKPEIYSSSDHKIHRPYALDVENNGALLLSDWYTLAKRFSGDNHAQYMLVDKHGISDFKQLEVSMRRNLDLISDQGQNSVSVSSSESYLNETSESPLIFVDGDHKGGIVDKTYRLLILSLAILLFSLLSIVILYVIIKCYKRRFYRSCYGQHSQFVNDDNCTLSKAKRSHKRKTYRRNDVTKVVNSSGTRTVCIEDLGGFTNGGFLNSSCKPNLCDDCEDKIECIEKGVCMSTYKLLN